VYGSEVHIWLVDVDDENAVRKAVEFLPEDERIRLGALLQPHRRRSICAQAALRILAAAATTGALPLPELVRGWNGKPVLQAWGHLDTGRPPDRPAVAADPAGTARHADVAPRPLHVSLSHSGALAAIALTTAGITGVDIEQVHELADPGQLARTTLSSEEYDQWRDVPAPWRSVAVFRAWTRKEAVLKALGTGLSGGLQSVSAPLRPARTGRVDLRALPEDAGRCDEWNVHDLPGWFGYLAAVAVRAPQVTVHQHEMRIGELLCTARPAPARESCLPVGTRRGGKGHALSRRSADVGSRG
jgi:4'-phosphopantetheinyl transferase